MQPEPLTRRNQDGTIYQRTPEVEAQITSVLPLPAPALIERASLRDPADPAFLREECLVYLIRHYQQVSQDNLVRGLSSALQRRCATRINRQLVSLGPDLAEEGFSAVVEQLFTRILNLASDRGDFLQARFWPALNYLIVDVFNHLAREQKRASSTVTLSALAGYDVDDADDAERQVQTIDPPVAPAQLSPEVRVLCREALQLLKPHHRAVFVLYHYDGWPIETIDPAGQSLSRHFGKSPRTIRYWLAQANQVLEDWRGEH